MADTNSYSGDEYSDEDEEGEELDPRVQDELEKLNVAANSINHLEAELDEARAVFRQTMAAATYHLNSQIKKLGNKNIQKARPFYDVLREMRKAHFELQQATLQYEKANSRHVCARQRVLDAENRVFSSGEKRAFDTALQEMLNQATIEVNEAENKKKESWLTHQKTYKSYQDIGKKAKEMENKLKKSVEKAKPYFVQKVGFDRHLWQLKIRVDSIQKGLFEAKQIYSECLRSLETISDDIHQKRKDKKTIAMIANLQEREAGVGADSEDEMSLDQSQLDLDLDCNTSISEMDGILPDNLPGLPPFSAGGGANKVFSGAEGSSASTGGLAEGLENMSLESVARGALDRQVSGAESSDSHASFASGSLKREVYGCEQDDDNAGECNSEGLQNKETEQIGVVNNLKTDDTCTPSIRTDAPENGDDVSEAQSSDAQGNGHGAKENVNSSDESVSPSQPEATGSHKQLENAVREYSNAITGHEGNEVDDVNQILKSETSATTEYTPTQNQECSISDSETRKEIDDAVVLETEDQEISRLDNNNADQSSAQEVSESTKDEDAENSEWI